MTESNTDLRTDLQIPGGYLSWTALAKRAAAAVFVVAISLFLFSSPTNGDNQPQQERDAQRQDGRRERFDFLVRADFFAGYAGDQAALARAMKVCEETLAKNPKHAEAMVWHGGGLMFLAGQAFTKADLRKGTDLWDRGLNEMDQAVDLEPDNVGVLIPRGATLLAVSRFGSVPETRRRLLQKGVTDYEKVIQIQKPYFNTLSGHARGELLFGLAEGWVRLGNNDKARTYFARIVDECKDSGRHPQAAEWLQKGTLASSSPMTCTGCHTR
jgi:hypothetical protein